MRPLRKAALCSAALGLTIGACDGSSPTDPGRSTMAAVQIRIDDPAGLFAEHHAAIRGLVEETSAKVRSAIPIDPVSFVVVADRARSIAGYGLGAYTLGPHDVEIVVDPEYAGLGAVLPERLPPAVAHELHHAVRWRGPGPWSTLLEALVFEGLADVFAVELLGTPLQPWSDAFPESETARYLDRARPELDDGGFDFFAWFLGSGTELPRWTGYTLGFRLVRAHQARTGRSAAQLVHTPAEAFRPE